MMNKILNIAVAMTQAVFLSLSMSMGMTLLSNVKAEEPDVAYGAKAWSETCVRCHNLRDPSEFSDYEWKPIMTHMRIRAGLTGQDTRAILAFIQASNDPILSSMAKNVAVIADTGLSGAEIYQTTCISCHGANGQGMIPGTPDFTQQRGRLSQSDEILFKRIKEGFQTPGNAMAMPARGGNPKLSDNDLKSVLSYLHQQFGS